MYLDKKQNFYKNRGWFARMQKGVFLVCFFVFWCFCFLVACVLVLVFCKKGPKRLFSCSFRGFLSICSHKRLALKCFISSYFVFCLAFVFLFNNPFLYFLLSINNFLENINVFGFFLFLFIAFSFLNVCLFLSNKLS